MNKFSVFLALIFFIIMVPIFLIISGVIFIDDGLPIIFSQVRIGHNGKKFEIYKFKTMKNYSIKNEKLRLTKLGIILRRLSLDEIPQFINVLNNDMSIVGPRPLPEKNEKKIKKKFRMIRRKVLPGITGLSQINYKGKYRKINDKVKLDIKYVKHYTFYNYLKIIAKTPIVLIIRLLKNKSSIIK